MSGERSLVDWQIAERTAGVVSAGLSAAGPSHDGYSAAEVEGACSEAIGVAAAYAGLGTVSDPPPPELIDRRGWARNALATLAEASRPIEERLAGSLQLPAPLGPIARRLAGAAAGAEAGIAVGYVARHVLGQYDMALFGPNRPSRLLFVAENMDQARHELDADPALFLRWVALHETTHVIQLERVAWLGSHLRELAGELVAGAARGLDGAGLRALAQHILRDPRAFVRSLLGGELTRVLADPGQRATLDRLQATMSVIEGHAEHVMDSAAPELGAELPALRHRLERRRERRGGIGEVIGRLLGIDLKLRQYRLGKAFCDDVAEAGGGDALRLVWSSAAHLPDLAELERPHLWLSRVDARA